MTGTPVGIASYLPWWGLPAAVLRSFAGFSQLPFHEVESTKVIQPGTLKWPIGEPSGTLRFWALQLAHAIRKADCARPDSFPEAFVGTVGFLVQQSYMFHWGRNNLRLARGMVRKYKDFTRSGLAGRVGQGLALLFMAEQGFGFAHQFEAFLEEQYEPSATHSMTQTVRARLNQRRGVLRRPDFVCEDNVCHRALAESKAGFLAVGAIPKVKLDLRHALRQLAPWTQVLRSDISKSFAIATYLREVADREEHGSLIAFVDPDGEDGIARRDNTPELIRRGNYAAWMTGMGLHEQASRLREWDEWNAPNRIRLPILRMSGGRRFAFTITGSYPLFDGNRLVGVLERAAHRGWHPLALLPFAVDAHLEVMGILDTTVRAIGESVARHQPQALMDVRLVDQPQAWADAGEGAFRGSVLSDGTLYGLISLSRVSELELEFEEFVL